LTLSQQPCKTAAAAILNIKKAVTFEPFEQIAPILIAKIDALTRYQTVIYSVILNIQNFSTIIYKYKHKMTKNIKRVHQYTFDVLI